MARALNHRMRRPVDWTPLPLAVIGQRVHIDAPPARKDASPGPTPLKTTEAGGTT
ncbi:MAG TPA: hypothetical protein VFC93_02470 [Chloroflexota bacterium]|nr:hypothetical protein [Chloroflexota bacterium]